MKRRKIKTERQRLEKKLDELWSKYVRLRAGNKCEKCGKDKYIHAHHIYSRSSRSTRWAFENGVSLCAGCHTFSSNFSAHKTPLEFIDWLREKKGQDLIDELKLKAHIPVKYLESDLEDMVEALAGELAKLATSHESQ